MWCGTFALESDFNSELMECGDRETAVTRGNKGMATQSSTYGFICSGARLLAILHVGRATSGEGILQRMRSGIGAGGAPLHKSPDRLRRPSPVAGRCSAGQGKAHCRLTGGGARPRPLFPQHIKRERWSGGVGDLGRGGKARHLIPTVVLATSRGFRCAHGDDDDHLFPACLDRIPDLGRSHAPPPPQQKDT
eukprot:gene8344-biopygen1589